MLQGEVVVVVLMVGGEGVVRMRDRVSREEEGVVREQRRRNGKGGRKGRVGRDWRDEEL